MAVGLLAMVVGVGFAWYAGREMLQQMASWSWPRAEAKVVRSQLHLEWSVAVSGRVRRKFIADLKFEYWVDGQVQWLERTRSGTRPEMTEVFAQYPLGKKVDVYFDPEKPSLAVIDRDQGKIVNKIATGSGVLFALLGLYLVCLALRSTPETDEPEYEESEEPRAVGWPYDSYAAER